MNLELSVVIPAYNEGDKIYKNALRVSEVVSSFVEKYEIVVVDDGSRDDTKDEALRAHAANHHVRVISYEDNGGKGKAVRTGIDAARGCYIAVLDADLDLPPEQLESYLHELQSDQADVVIGSKMHKDSHLEYPPVRKIMSFGYYCMLRTLFRLKLKDTQTGIKMFKAEAIKPVIDKIQTKGFAYDIEMMVALNCRKCRIKEMPVKLVFTRGKGMGRIRIKDVWNMLGDTLKVWMRAVKGYYG